MLNPRSPNRTMVKDVVKKYIRKAVEKRENKPKSQWLFSSAVKAL
jgi:hypothetical protein